MLRCLLSSIAILLLLGTGAQALEVTELVMTTSVVDREPVDRVEVFPRQSGMLYCFSRVEGAAEETSVVHLWYRDDALVSRVALPVRSPSWRTWSAKQLLDEGPGTWRVEVQDALGQSLREVGFAVR